MDKIRSYLKDNNDRYLPLLVKELKDYAIFLMTTDGHVASWNYGAELLKGYSEKEIIGQHYRILFPERLQKTKEPEKEIEEALKKGRYEGHEWRRKKSGEEFFAHVVLTPLYDDNKKVLGFAKITQDITEERNTQKKVKEQSEKIRHTKEFSEAIFNTVNEGIIVIDVESKIVNANDAFLKMFNLSADKTLGERLSSTHKAWKTTELEQLISKMISKGKYFTDKEIEFELKGGKKILSVTSKFIHHNQNKELKILLIFTDITTEREIEITKSDFTSFVSHELRTPITSIKAYAQLMERCINNEMKCDLKKYLSKTILFTDRLTALINELHETNKAGADKIQVDRKLVNFEDLINDTLETIKTTFPDQVIEKEGEVKLKLKVDPARIAQVFTNYITNAIKYSSGKPINVRLEHDREKVTVAVKDQGKGISKEDLKKIFSRYYRAGKTSKIEGLGMGLFLAKKIIKAHKGEVWVESEEGKGAVFYFTLPLKDKD